MPLFFFFFFLLHFLPIKYSSYDHYFISCCIQSLISISPPYMKIIAYYYIHLEVVERTTVECR